MKCKSDIIWTTQKGEDIHISDMHDGHLVNTVFYIGKKVRKEHKHRTWAWVQSVSPLEEFDGPDSEPPEKEYPTIFYNMLQELEKRGILICASCKIRFECLAGDANKCFLKEKGLV